MCSNTSVYVWNFEWSYGDIPFLAFTGMILIICLLPYSLNNLCQKINTV